MSRRSSTSGSSFDKLLQETGLVRSSRPSLTNSTGGTSVSSRSSISNQPVPRPPPGASAPRGSTSGVQSRSSITSTNTTATTRAASSTSSLVHVPQPSRSSLSSGPGGTSNHSQPQPHRPVQPSNQPIRPTAQRSGSTTGLLPTTTPTTTSEIAAKNSGSTPSSQVVTQSAHTFVPQVAPSPLPSSQPIQPTPNGEDGDDYSDDYENYDDDGFDDAEDDATEGRPSSGEAAGLIASQGTAKHDAAVSAFSVPVATNTISMSWGEDDAGDNENLEAFSSGSKFGDYLGLQPMVAPQKGSEHSNLMTASQAGISDPRVNHLDNLELGDSELAARRHRTQLSVARQRQRLRALEALSAEQRDLLHNRARNLLGRSDRRSKIQLVNEAIQELLCIPSAIGLRRSLTAEEVASGKFAAATGIGAGAEWLLRKEKTGEVRSVGTTTMAIEVDDETDSSSVPNGEDSSAQLTDYAMETKSDNASSSSLQTSMDTSTQSSVGLFQTRSTQTPGNRSRCHVSIQVDSLRISEYLTNRLSKGDSKAGDNLADLSDDDDDPVFAGRPEVESWTVNAYGEAEEEPSLHNQYMEQLVMKLAASGHLADAERDLAANRRQLQRDPRSTKFCPVSKDPGLKRVVTIPTPDSAQPELNGEDQVASSSTKTTHQDDVVGLTRFLTRVAPTCELLLVENSEREEHKSSAGQAPQSPAEIVASTLPKASSLLSKSQAAGGVHGLAQLLSIPVESSSNTKSKMNAWSTVSAGSLVLPDNLLPPTIQPCVTNVQFTRLPRGILSAIGHNTSQCFTDQHQNPLQFVSCAAVAYSLESGSATSAIRLGSLAAAFKAQSNSSQEQWEELCAQSNSLVALYDLTREDTSRCVAIFMCPSIISCLLPPQASSSTPQSLASGIFPSYLFVAGSSDGQITLWNAKDTPVCVRNTIQAIIPVFAPLVTTAALVPSFGSISGSARAKTNGSTLGSESRLYTRITALHLIPVHGGGITTPGTSVNLDEYAAPTSLTADSLRGLKLLATDALGNTVLFSFVFALQRRDKRSQGHFQSLLRCLDLRPLAHLNLVAPKAKHSEPCKDLQDLEGLGEVTATALSVGSISDDDILLVSLSDAATNRYRGSGPCSLRGLALSQLPALSSGDLTSGAIAEIYKTYLPPASSLGLVSDIVGPASGMSELPHAISGIVSKATAIAFLSQHPRAQLPRRRGLGTFAQGTTPSANEDSTALDPYKVVGTSVLFLAGYSDGSLALFATATPAAPIYAWNNVCDAAITTIFPLSRSSLPSNPTDAKSTRYPKVVGEFLLMDSSGMMHFWSLSRAAEIAMQAVGLAQRGQYSEATTCLMQANFTLSGPLLSAPDFELLCVDKQLVGKHIAVTSVPSGFLLAATVKDGLKGERVIIKLVETNDSAQSALATYVSTSAGASPASVSIRDDSFNLAYPEVIFADLFSAL